jgi:hypothetical protein
LEKKWRMLISVLLGKYELSDHVAFETPAADHTAEWNREDFIVRSWLYGSISDEILDIIMAENQSAFDAYMLIRNLFLDNQMTRAVHLEAEFRALVQGDLSITAYCRNQKSELMERARQFTYTLQHPHSRVTREKKVNTWTQTVVTAILQ